MIKRLQRPQIRRETRRTQELPRDRTYSKQAKKQVLPD